MRTHFKFYLILAFAVTFMSTNAQEKSGYTFNDKIDIEVTSVKDQHRSGTCWSFASISFLEAELLRETGKEYDLSEMYLVRNCYIEKADRYVRMHGKTNFGGGGLAHDLLMVWERYGLVTEDAYPGLVIGEDGHVHGEMDGQLRAFVESLIKNRNRKLTPVWDDAFKGILDAYMGPRPTTFNVDGQSYTPREFADNLPLTPGDYVTIGSFTHQPYYEPFILEIPDNWDWNTIENVQLDEMMNVLDNALEDGYTVCWDADVSEKGFKWGSGISLIPEQDIESLDNLEQAKWSELSDNEKQAMLYDFSKPRKEQVITPEIRQKWFDNYITTDDHLMLITGTAVDQNGNKFYKVKNSWGVGNHIYDGYFYCSEAYMRAKTIFFMVNKDAVPKPLSKKLGL
ncbi:MAG TPA: C1 family peptidase [Bacteroidales bacterium]|nr:C1 family peptidase [Bacteroidales bacterium]